MKKEKLEKKKKEMLMILNVKNYVPMKKKELAMLLDIPRGKRDDLSEVLDALEIDGLVRKDEQGRYSAVKDFSGVKAGRASANKTDKYERNNSSRKTDKAGKHDKLGKLGRIDRSAGTSSDSDTKVGFTYLTDPDNNFIVGTYENDGNFGFVVPDDKKIEKDIFIPSGRSMDAVDGHKVVVEIDSKGDNRKSPEGHVVEILGHRDDPGMDILSIVRAYNIPDVFPDKVMEQAKSMNKPISEADMAGRKDFRDLFMVTIDGEDTKDIDDAITLSMDGENYILGVHIADVSNYVQESSALDREAYKRGTSVYLLDRVIPMLPHELSNGICSLNEGEERLALSCVMTINPEGKIIAHDICESVVKSNKKMTYTIVGAIVERNEFEDLYGRKRTAEEEAALAKYMDEYSEMVPTFDKMYELSKILRARRDKRGAIEFDFPETKIELDGEKVVDVHPYPRNESCKIIEDFMLAANETVAEHFFKKKSPFLYRVHGTPDPDRIKTLANLVKKWGFSLKADPNQVKPMDVKKLIDKVSGTEQEFFISRLALRSMARACYGVECEGHFGLAAEYYCHFTSPIRRYPDLQIHRIIKDHLRGRMNGERGDRLKKHYSGILTEVAVSTSRTERRAEECEREVDKLKKVQYMEERKGEVFEGIISSVTSWGFYVELPNTVDGLVHISTLRDDHYVYYEDSFELVGARRGKVYTMGQTVKVTVTATDIDRRTIDFELV